MAGEEYTGAAWGERASRRMSSEIAYRLGVSAKTVATHRKLLMERLDIHDVAGIVRYAIRTGVVTPDDSRN